MGKVKLWLLAACSLAAPLAAHAQTPLQELGFSRGGIVVRYERATAGDEAFARLAAERSSAPVRVVATGVDEAAAGVASAYAEGLRALFADVERVDAPERLPAGAYLVQIQVMAVDEAVEGSERVYGVRQVGVSCRAAGNSVECADFGGVPVQMGTQATADPGRRMEALIRFHRLDARGERAVVFEDSYSVHYRQVECGDGAAAAATLAGAVARHALSERPWNIRFNSSPDLLRCRGGG